MTRGPGQPSPDDDVILTGRFWRRLALLGALVNTALFFRGCSMDETAFTCGFPAPAIEVHIRDEPTGCRFDNPSATAIFTNLGALVLCGLVVYALPALQPIFFDPRFSVAAGISFLAFNMAVIWPWLWMNTTFALEVWLLDMFFENERRVWVMDVFSRAYFMAHTITTYVLVVIVQRVWLRFVSKPGGAWWQFRLAGIFTVMTVVCVITALVLHWTQSR